GGLPASALMGAQVGVPLVPRGTPGHRFPRASGNCVPTIPTSTAPGGGIEGLRGFPPRSIGMRIDGRYASATPCRRQRDVVSRATSWTAAAHQFEGGHAFVVALRFHDELRK